MTPLSNDEEELALEGCLDLALAEQAALRPLERLSPAPCPPELARRTVRRLCAMVREEQPPVPTQTPPLCSHDLKGFWLCLSSNILMM
jgi:hypothetical protein